MSNIDKQAGEGDVSPKTYYIHPMAFGSTKNPGYGHVPVVHADDSEMLRAKLEAAEKRIAELEARTVTLPENITSANAPEVFEISAEAERLGLRGTYASYAVGWNARGIADKEALREAGVKVAAAGKGEAS
ncbi:TPA: hypothetical protein QHJ70_004818 [Enterobacter hormaechei subsp. steigerwaltii]|uniref:hypothetical protein n=1 Tax=Enterobacter hormaechei TaxID=158836 RepID=UPI00125C6A4D|nr:hypothetical protein [Enterobacter hormaechei]HDS5227286.1 hypothetical protein [Enterobacter hormaechei subsp. steigerwaltii]MCM6982201.1 hypothetical protein [Enterobacter hormaechei]MCR4034948.1 hypothetical protein [Enterobacter hormaechei]VAF24346.1 Uncharacterised protein [Enterobacter hormaechei]HDT5352272.1 hypothetical protein [Enterobacter hormaechei subsp. steigerwaltii]